MLKKLLLLLCFSGVAGFAQKPAEISIISDNDLYTSIHNDQYYTNGLEIMYRYLGNPKRDNVAKKITAFSIGQYIYNPQSPKTPEIEVQDRPFAGYLFAKAGITTFYKSENVFEINFSGGIVGPESGAEEAQKLLHRTLHYGKVEGWDYQIRTTPAAQVEATYSHKIFRERFHEKVDMYLMGEANLGTIWLSGSVGGMMRISLKGNLKPMYESALHNAYLTKGNNPYEGRREWLLFLNPSLQYMGFDATIEGSPFDNKSPVTFPLLPFRFNAQAGAKHGRNNWNYAFVFNYRGKELSNNVITGFYYGSVQVGYLF